MKKKTIEQIKEGDYSAIYFLKTQQILKNNKNTCVMQFIHFKKEPIMVCGIKESLKIINEALSPEVLKRTKIWHKNDGDIVSKDEPVLLIEGYYQDFAHLENIIDGILARMSSVATNSYKMLQLIDTKKLIFMADRSDCFVNQPYDGYAAYIAGVRNFVTKAHIAKIKNINDVNVIGTIPHALIQQCNGDIVGCLKKYSETFPDEKLVALIDFHNDIEAEIKKIKAANLKIDMVRIDTSSALVDEGLKRRGIEKNGVNPDLVKLCRQTLDQLDMSDVKIIVSSSIDYNKVEQFERSQYKPDFYGIGSSLIERTVHFSADLVMLNNKPLAKKGRNLLRNKI